MSPEAYYRPSPQTILTGGRGQPGTVRHHHTTGRLHGGIPPILSIYTPSCRRIDQRPGRAAPSTRPGFDKKEEQIPDKRPGRTGLSGERKRRSHHPHEHHRSHPIIPNHTSEMNPAGTGRTGTVLCCPHLSVHYFAILVHIRTTFDFFANEAASGIISRRTGLIHPGGGIITCHRQWTPVKG